MGDARISGRYSPFPLFNRSRLEALTLSWNGLDLSFSRTSDPALVRLDSSQDSADILLTGDERLHLSLTGNRGSALTISPVQPWPATASVITIPFKVSGVLEDREDGERLSWRQGGRAFQLLLPQDARVDYYSREIALQLGGSPGTSEMSFVALSPAPFQETPASSRVAPRLPDEKSLVTQEQMAASLARFADSAYAGWSLSRYSLNDGTWRMADGRQGFSRGYRNGPAGGSGGPRNFQGHGPDMESCPRRPAERQPGAPPGVFHVRVHGDGPRLRQTIAGRRGGGHRTAQSSCGPG